MYFLVDDKVSVRPSSSQGKLVTRSNYENISVKGNNYRYNTITLSKILHGDTSDCIPALPKDIQKKMTSFFVNDAIYPHLGNKDTLLYFAQMAFPEAIPQIELVFPLFVDDVPTDFKKPNWSLMCCFGNAMHNKNFKNYTRPDFDVEPHVATMQARGLYVEEVN